MGHGIHQMDLLLSILGDWTEVVAVAARQARPTITEDLSAAIDLQPLSSAAGFK